MNLISGNYERRLNSLADKKAVPAIAVSRKPQHGASSLSLRRSSESSGWARLAKVGRDNVKLWTIPSFHVTEWQGLGVEHGTAAVEG
jgi:hypothetical protein